VTKQYADGTLPAPGVYGVPDQWPHVRAAFEQAGFVHDGHTEIVYLASSNDLPGRGEAPDAGTSLRRSLGINGTRFSAVLRDVVVGYIEVDLLQVGERLPRSGGWADIGNLHIAEEQRRQGVATWLIGQAADWLRLANIDRLLAYAGPEQQDCTAFYAKVGFRELARTQRGWVRR